MTLHAQPAKLSYQSGVIIKQSYQTANTENLFGQQQSEKITPTMITIIQEEQGETQLGGPEG